MKRFVYKVQEHKTEFDDGDWINWFFFSISEINKYLKNKARRGYSYDIWKYKVEDRFDDWGLYYDSWDYT